ncbi:MAG: cell division protein FtsZ [Candidatus Latescibacterota bacterium]|nr:MAG: cell division protein FtsZ [Candidatus Latescibacterota bacterium]
MRFEFDDFDELAKLKVVGVGGAGGNAVNRMIAAGLQGVEFLAVNTDVQVLELSRAHKRIQVGNSLTKGLGSGGDPDVGRRAMEEDADLVAESLAGADMVFVTAGMGGGTGTGAGPLVARIARELGALTVGIVTRPFTFEGKRRHRQALEGIAALKQEVDTLIIIQNDKLLSIVGADTPLTTAFSKADDVLLHATKGISDLILTPGLINLDFADVRSIMSGMGDALMGTGTASGEERATKAARIAITSPLLDDVSIKGAKGVLVNITGDENMTLHEISQATSIISQEAGEDANVIFGAVVNRGEAESLQVTVIATGFTQREREIFPLAPAAERIAVSERIPAAEPRPAPVAVPVEIPVAETKTPDIVTIEALDEARIEREEAEGLARVGLHAVNFGSYHEPNLDIPTFLRKQLD